MLNKILNVVSIMVAYRLQSAEVVLWALETHGRRMADALAAMFGVHLGACQAMPFEVEIDLFKKELTRLRDELLAAERANRTQKSRETLSRARRDALIEQVNGKLANVRGVFKNAYTDEQLAEIGFSRRNARQPEQLLEQAAYLAVRLGRPDLELSESRFEGFTINASTFVRDLAPLAKDLRQSMSDLRRQERLSEETQVAKDEAMSEFNHGFLWIARSVESKLQLAGMEKLAARVRPSSRRPGVTEKLETEGDEPDADSQGPENTAEEGTTPTEAAQTAS